MYSISDGDKEKNIVGKGGRRCVRGVGCRCCADKMSRGSLTERTIFE